ncbi:MAG: pirin family protein [Actinobacteria bacterium]|nr:pirin family protein [Actinomycetota bacterium]
MSESTFGDTSIVPARQRFETDTDWLTSRHSFSFGHHYDPANTHFGCLLVNNDDVVLPGTGFDTHPHRDMEIVTWVLSGSLVHQDSEGNNGVIYPGLAQRMSAGHGILHSERNDSWRLTGNSAHDEPVHFIQMWVRPDENGLDPGYEQRDINDELATGELVVVASGLARHRSSTAIRIAQRDAGLHAGRLAPGATTRLPDARLLHVFVARGAVTLGKRELVEGDSARLVDSGGISLAAGPIGAEVLVWEMNAATR